jgi:hypothetical protein
LRARNTTSPSRSSAIAAALAVTKLSSVFGSSAAIQRASVNSAVSHITSSRYSSLSRACNTSSCSEPTTPTSAGEPSCGRNTCTTPSSAICCSASRSCFALIASGKRTRRRISGAKLGTPTKFSTSPSVSVSPIRNVP